MGTSEILLILSPFVITAGLLRYRRDYRRHGRTTKVGVFLLLAAWFMPMSVLGFAVPLFSQPERPAQFIGYGLMVLALVLTLIPLRRFSSRMVVGWDADRLVTSGAYRWSRNPQYVAFVPFALGYAMTGRSILAYIGVALFLLVVHLTMLVEEEHLERVFGDAYRRYRQATPRYLFR